jgi:hypothetical protein
MISNRGTAFQYVGQTALTAIGPITGRQYRFSYPGAIVEVDPRDRESLSAVPNVRLYSKSAIATESHPMAENNIELDATAQAVDGASAIDAPPVAEASAAEPAALLTPESQPTEPALHPEELPSKPIAYQDFKAGDADPLVGLIIKEVLAKANNFVVYIAQDLSLYWHWTQTVDPNSTAPIFNRASELQAKSEFLRQTLYRRDLLSARRLIGQGLVVMFCTQTQAYANAALDTADKFITQRGRETSRGWYFGPFFVFFAASVLIGLILYRKGQMQITTLPLVCALGGGIGAFISSAIGNERIPCAPSAGWILHVLEALLRYTIGFAAGLLVWLASAGNIAIGFFNLAGSHPASPLPDERLPASIYALITLALLAGTSERLLPSLIARFDDSTKGTSGAQATETQTPKPNSTTPT